MKLGLAIAALGAALLLVSFKTAERTSAVATQIVEDALIPDAKELVTGPAFDSISNTILRPKQTIKLSELKISNRQVKIFDEITPESSAATVRQILSLGTSSLPITIVLNSPGGSVFAGADIISAMEAAKGPVNTLCVGLCASMAAMIHSYGTNRYMTNRSVLMFHPAAGGIQGTLPQMHNRLSLIESFIGKMEAHVASRAGISWQQYSQRASNEIWLDSEDATAQKFNDRIVFVRGASGSDLYSFGDGSGLKLNRLQKYLVNF